MKKSLIALSVVSGLALSTALFIAGCATPVEVLPTTQPGGWQTPHIKPSYPPGPGLGELPAGFKPCGDYVSTVKLDDGTTVNVRICVYCSSNPNDRTVYVQQDCAGNYRPGQRNPNPGQPTEGPRSKPLGNLRGSLNLDQSNISFTVDEAFSLDPANLKGSSAQMLINGKPVEKVMRGTREGNNFPAGTQITISGDNVGIADLLYWNFGAGQMTAMTDFGNVVTLNMVYTEATGMNVVVHVDGTYMPQAGGMIPWRGK